VEPVDDQFADAQIICGSTCWYAATTNPSAAADADADAPCRLWVERMRMLYEIVGAGVPVIMSDLDAIWFKDALSDIEVRPG
jgi:hypothetical protein